VALYLGFDSSTQGLTVTAIEVIGAARSVCFSRTLNYDRDLPHYHTTYGVLSGPNPEVVHAPPLMWTEALDGLMHDITSREHVDWSSLRAISGSAQQHGSVYLTADAAPRLAHLDPAQPLAEQLKSVFSRATSPIWMDSSTTIECREIERTLGGADKVAQETGSRAFERFTGPQIRKFWKDDRGGFERTGRIHLVSSWMASLLAGADAPLDAADASGMNLMRLERSQWWPKALDATAPDLAQRLPAIVAPWTIAGLLDDYWVRRHNLPRARVVVWSGDNPCSLVGTGAVREGMLTISLGTSDTIFGPMDEPRVSRDGTGHVFASPTGAFMGMTVFQNGSLARQRIRDRFGLDWNGFAAALASTPPANRGAIMLPWFGPEITPAVRVGGVYTQDVDEHDGPSNVRAIVEGQMMAMALHSRWMGIKPRIIHATGGASNNDAILQIMADVFDATVHRLPSSNSAALGAALRAYHADRVADGQALSWEDVCAEFTAATPVASPVEENVKTYKSVIERYRALESSACGWSEATE
jgi:xylulokinase